MTAEKNALIGGLVTILWWGWSDPSIVELALAFAFLVLVPLVLQLAVPSYLHSWPELWLNKYSRCSLPFALFGIASLSIEAGWLSGMLAGVWFIFTGAISMFAFLRMIARGFRPAEETIIDVGSLYLIVGGGWFVLSRIGSVSFLPYSDVIVELTAIHFHYSAFILPILTGIFGRWLYQQSTKRNTKGKLFTILAWGIALGPIIVAFGLDLGPPIELYFVSFYVLFVIWLCGWWLKSVKRMDKKPGIFLGLSALIILGTMTLSLLYSLGLYLGMPIISIPGMIRWHGALNAFGFAFIGTVGWLVINPKLRHNYSQFPVSCFRGKGFIGSDIFTRYSWIDSEKTCTGLVGPSWERFKHASFDPNQLEPLIREFYLETNKFHMDAKVNWHKGFKALSTFSYFITKKMGQIQLPTSQSIEMVGEIIPILDEQDGRDYVRAWVRKNKQTNEPIFSAIYSSHTYKDKTYMNIALPLYRGVMTGVLRPEHDNGNGLVLTSERLIDQKGDEGIYLTFQKMTLKTPLEETFHIVSAKDGVLKAKHDMTCFGMTFLTIEYDLYK